MKGQAAVRNSHRVFVYGTLRRGFENHFFLRNARFLGAGRTKECYALYADGLPYVIKDEPRSRICGELYDVDGKTLEAMDHLEGHPLHYRRTSVDVLDGDGRTFRAWVYFYPERRGTLIQSGDYGDDTGTHRKKEMSGPSDPAGEMTPVRYRVGNIGDLLKHSWLIEILTFLKKQKTGPPFHYADTFSGFYEYPIGRGQAERIRKRLSRSPLFRIQENVLLQGRYYGSVSIAGKVLGPSARLEVFDRNPNALACFSGLSVDILKIKSGYDVLNKRKPCDLIFLDPYDDFIDEHEEVLPKILRKIKDSSIFLFFPFRHPAHEKAVLRILGLSGSRYIHGSVGKGTPVLDGRYRFAALFLPARHLDVKACRPLARRLGAVTARIRGLETGG
jgi:gamma-glutamylaminecyclotransferase